MVFRRKAVDACSYIGQMKKQSVSFSQKDAQVLAKVMENQRLGFHR